MARIEIEVDDLTDDKLFDLVLAANNPYKLLYKLIRDNQITERQFNLAIHVLVDDWFNLR